MVKRAFCSMPAALLGAAILVPGTSLPARAFDHEPGHDSAMTPTQNSTYIVPPAMPAIDDHSATTTPGGELNAINLTIGQARENEPSRFLLLLSGEVRGISDRFVISAPALSYSDTDGLDISLRPAFGASRGFSIGVSRELTSRRGLRDAVGDMRSLISSFKGENARDLGADKRGLYDETRKFLAKRANVQARKLRVSLNAGYTRNSAIDFGQRVGRREDYADRVVAGVAVSQLIGLHETKVSDNSLTDDDKRAYRWRLGSPAAFWAVSAQAVHLDSDRTGSVTGLRLGLRLGWQDAIPEVVSVPEELQIPGEPKEVSRRWHWQTGVEFVPPDSTTDKPAIAVFVRHRVQPSAKEREKMTWSDIVAESFEVSLSGGATSSGHAFVAVRLTKAFSF